MKTVANVLRLKITFQISNSVVIPCTVGFSRCHAPRRWRWSQQLQDCPAVLLIAHSSQW